MANSPEPDTQQPEDYESTLKHAGQRGRDERKADVNPADSPAPRSPAPDEAATRAGEEILERVKPY